MAIDTAKGDKPCFSVENEDKLVTIKLLDPSISLQELRTGLITSVGSTKGESSSVHLDLRGLLGKQKGSEVNSLAKVLLPLVLDDSVRNIQLPSALSQILTGRCIGLVNEALKCALGGDTLGIEDVTIKVRDITKLESILTCKMSGENDKDLQTTLKVLGQLEESKDYHGQLSTAVIRAYKVLRKKQKVKRAGEMFTTVMTDSLSHKGEESREEGESHMKEPLPLTQALSAAQSKVEIPSERNIIFLKRKIRMCYICKKKYQHQRNLVVQEMQYPRMCKSCAEFNYTKRHQRVDLKGKYAVVTGGRIKIGFELVLRLLRDGCHVIATTRFPKDAAERFAKEPDFNQWSLRLRIYGLDLQDLFGISKFVQFVRDTFPCLDILINNAAQTIRRPNQFYQHLISTEQKSLTESAQSLLANDCQQQRVTNPCHKLGENQSPPKRPHSDPTESLPGTSSTPEEFEPLQKRPCTMIPITGTSSEAPLAVNTFFPDNCFDGDGQQLDLRPTNSWRSELHDVPPSELIEVLLINTVAPCILTQQLRPLLLQSPAERKFVVNVSAMEGQFQRASKTKFHPHTNMAKAALNMMTRTAGLGYAQDGIYMTAVDTGWVTDERPFHMASHERDIKGFVLPLDCTDGAARVYDPIVMGLSHKEKPNYAVFLKNYQPYPW